MKHRDLIRELERLGWALVRATGPHDVYGRGKGRIPVPRHRELNENLAKKILRDACER